MTPPVNIGGDTVEAITIDGTSVSKVTVDGSTVFSLVPSYYTHQWKLKEGSGSTAADAVGSATASLNGPAWTSGNWIGGYALQANSSNNDFVDLTPLGNFGSTMDNGFAWIFTYKTTETAALFGAVDGNQEFVVALGDIVKGSAGAINFEIDDDGNSNTEAINTDSTGFADGTRRRIVCQTGDATAGTHEIWVNGNQESTSITSSQGGSSYVDFSNSIYMFAVNDGGDSANISATIDNVIVTDRKLTQSEIQDDYNNQPWV